MVSSQLTVHEKKSFDSIKTGKSKAEIFNSIVANIKVSYEGKITEEEARKSARNFIAFCQKLIDIQLRIEKENEKK